LINKERKKTEGEWEIEIEDWEKYFRRLLSGVEGRLIWRDRVGEGGRKNGT